MYVFDQRRWRKFFSMNVVRPEGVREYMVYMSDYSSEAGKILALE